MTGPEEHMSGRVRPSRPADNLGSVSLPVFMLTLLGPVITALGLFTAGEIELVMVGLVSVAVAGLIHAFGTKEVTGRNRAGF